MERDIKFMKMAYKHAKDRSNDPRTNTGAVIFRDNEILSLGANEVVYGLNFSKYMGESQNKAYFLHHAERKSLACCARDGIKTFGASMATPWEPCSPCGLMIADAGIKELILHKDLNDYYRANMTDDKWLKDQDMALEMLDKAGVNVRYLEGKLFSPEENFFINFRGERFSP